MPTFLSRRTRVYLYTVSLAALPLLVIYASWSPDHLPVWATFIGTLLGVSAPFTALVNVTDDDPNGAHWDDDLSATESELEHENG